MGKQAGMMARLHGWKLALGNMSPAIFGLVMATGIIALAADQLGHTRIAMGLFSLNIGQYALLCLLLPARLLLCRPQFRADLADHARAPGFFTLVAASGIIGRQFFVQGDAPVAGLILWGLTGGFWLLLGYGIFTALIIGRQKPVLANGINGGWLLAVVATQSLSVLSTTVATHGAPGWQAELYVLALGLWLWGCMLHIMIATLLFYRYLFRPLTAADLIPPDWINMGAMAISTLAGTLLLLSSGQDMLLLALKPFLLGLTIFCWAVGSWWIPLLVLLGIWRHGVKRVPFRHDPLYWGLVFPLGMYAAASWQLGQLIGAGWLIQLSSGFFLAGILAWGLVFAGTLRRLMRIARNK